ncbi:hypothetical protein KKF32_03710 [Patescibacteria group bacterium]|nr:hypothetical protein [Patescibacteria group bacterium]
MFNELKLWLERINYKYLFDYFLVVLLALTLFFWLQSSQTLPEPDSFYHAKVSELLSSGKILKQLPWLQETNLKDVFVDHHFLYHLLLIPVVSFFNPLVGVKAATVIFATLLVLIIYWLFKQYHIKWPFIFICFLLAAQPWLFRISLVKVPVVFLILMILAFYCLTHQKKILLFIIAFASVWLYAGWPLIVVMGVLYAILVKIVKIIRRKHQTNQKLLSPASELACLGGGILAGIVINPYFPANLFFYWQQFVKIAVINYHRVIGVGGEWYPYGFLKLITDAPLICSLLLVGIFVFILTLKKQSVYSWLWGVLGIAFFLLTLKSRRYVEVYVPFTVIFFAFSLSDFIKSRIAQKLWLGLSRTWKWTFSLLFSVILLGLIINIPYDLRTVKKDMEQGFPLNHYQKASSWLRENTPLHSVIFHADWDDFPALFYYNDHNYYLTGLDPTFMYEYNKEKYWQYVNITLGSRQIDLGKIIQEQFKADYVFLDKKHQTLDNTLKLNPNFTLLYEDSESKIYYWQTNLWK